MAKTIYVLPDAPVVQFAFVARATNKLAVNFLLGVEASHFAISKTENASDRLVFKPVRLPLERFAFEISDGLPDLCDDRAIRGSMKAHRLDVRTDFYWRVQ